jgi:predicted metalloprotease with PDZ domain
VSYYVKGQVVGFLLDARIRAATGGERDFEDFMRLAYLRYGGERGFTPEELQATAEEVAGVELDDWFERALASTEELDYTEALEWFGLRFAEDGSWTLEVREDASEAQRGHLAALLTPAHPDNP